MVSREMRCVQCPVSHFRPVRSFSFAADYSRLHPDTLQQSRACLFTRTISPLHTLSLHLAPAAGVTSLVWTDYKLPVESVSPRLESDLITIKYKARCFFFAYCVTQEGGVFIATGFKYRDMCISGMYDLLPLATYTNNPPASFYCGMAKSYLKLQSDYTSLATWS
jgi:hypothetical protein